MLLLNASTTSEKYSATCLSLNCCHKFDIFAAPKDQQVPSKSYNLVTSHLLVDAGCPIHGTYTSVAC